MSLVLQNSKPSYKSVSYDSQKENIVYIRVSSSKQKYDLQRQHDFLSQQFPGYRIVSDIGSGINFKRKGFLSILEQVKNGKVQTVVVASRDRLCRFGFDLMEWYFKTFNTKLVVLQQDSSASETLAQDVLSIIQVFNCRNNGRRRYKTNKSQQNLVEN
jgi:predicted site-specific integrase-resolvase